MIRKVLLSTVFAATAGAAVAADLPSTKGPAPFVAPPVFTWTGFYVGLNAGGQFGTSNARLVVPAIVNGVANNINATATTIAVGAGNGSIDPTGFTGGLTVGYNWQMNSLVFGVEGDINYSGLSGNRTGLGTAGGFQGTATDRIRTNWFGTVRARLGFAADRALFYVTGGAAFTDAQFSRSLDWTFNDLCPASPIAGAGVRCHVGSVRFNTGWTVGGGIEYAFTNNWTAKAEYLYSDFGSRSFQIGRAHV